MNPRLCLLLLTLITGSARANEPIPRPEHPDPSAVRSHWSNLNGRWQFRFDPSDQGLKAQWFALRGPAFEKTITVPFGWESELSGIQDTTKSAKIGWYRRTFQVPANFPPGLHVWLRFGAVDWRADVWVNGQKAASHEGGYSPFEADITDLIRRDGENLLVVRALDATDPALPTGKQVGWYTPTSGIWQTVWLEARPRTYLSRFKIETQLNPAQAAITVAVQDDDGKPLTVSVRSDDSTVSSSPIPVISGSTPNGDAGPAGGTVKVQVQNAQAWSPETPHLYPVTVELKDETGRLVDSVQTYFGLRTISRGKVGNEPFERVLLNGKPIYLRLALDQSFNPKGIYTAPTEDFLKKDLELAKVMGLNGLRIHIKPEEPRRLYWADKLGLLIMEDMPNTWAQNPSARTAWESSMRQTIARDQNHPSIFAWVAFNETWGLGSPDQYKASKETQTWVKSMVQSIRTLDPTRLVEDNSPCNYDHVSDTDLNSWHFYIDDAQAARTHLDEVVSKSTPGSPFNYCPGERMTSAPVINSEYGAVSAGSGDRDISWGFRDLTTQLRRYPKIQGYGYTELTDVEWEHNGFVNYDRTPKVFGYEAFVPNMTVADLQGADFVGYDSPPVIQAKPGETIRLPIFVSHFSERTEPPTLRWWVMGVNDQGLRDERKMPDRPVVWAPYDVTPQKNPLEFTIEGTFAGAVGFELVDAAGKRLAANFVNVVATPEVPADRVQRLDDHHTALRFKPEDFSHQSWSGGLLRSPGKVSGLGTGQFTYTLAVPAAVRQASPTKARIRLELAARAGRNKVDWPQRPNPQDYPQTDSRLAPSNVRIAIGPDILRAASLPDDPADSRGILSHIQGTDHGSYGYRVEFEVELSAAARKELEQGQPLTIRLEVPEAGGLCVYGSETGAFPFDPTVILTTDSSLPSDLGVVPSEPVATDRYSARLQTLLPSADQSADNPPRWRYSTSKPASGWEQAGFNDASWASGPGAFGSPGTPGIRVGTKWNSPRIYLRNQFEAPSLNPGDELTLRLFHDEDAAIFINGTRLLTRQGYGTSPEEIALNAQQLALFVQRTNTIAVECLNTSGGQGVDVGLWLQKAK